MGTFIHSYIFLTWKLSECAVSFVPLDFSHSSHDASPHHSHVIVVEGKDRQPLSVHTVSRWTGYTFFDLQVFLCKTVFVQKCGAVCFILKKIIIFTDIRVAIFRAKTKYIGVSCVACQENNRLNCIFNATFFQMTFLRKLNIYLKKKKEIKRGSVTAGVAGGGACLTSATPAWCNRTPPNHHLLLFLELRPQHSKTSKLNVPLWN